MDGEEDGHQDLHCDNQTLVIGITSLLHRVHADHKHCEDVEDNAMVDGTDAAPERAEGEELLCRPDLVDSVGVLNFLLLDRLLVELSRDLVPMDVPIQLHIVQDGQEVRAAHDAFD